MKKSKKPKKIRSIKHQITFTFIGLLFLSILTISMINGAFLEKYYVFQKRRKSLLESKGSAESDQHGFYDRGRCGKRAGRIVF